MKLIKYTNIEGGSISLSAKPPFFLTKIAGFGPVQNEIKSTQLYGLDGAVVSDKKLVIRDLEVEGEILANSSVDLAEYRREIAVVLNPKISGTLLYEEDGKMFSIDVEIEHGPDFDMDKSNITQKFKLLLKALDPYWTDKSEIDAEIPMARIEPLFSFPLNITNTFEFAQLIAGDVIEIQNNGHVSVGAVFTINVNGPLVNPRLYNVITQDYFALKGTFMTGTKLRISTVRGKKKVEQDDGDGWYNIMTKRKVESKFLQIDRGINYLQLQADSGVKFTTSYIKFDPKLLGV